VSFFARFVLSRILLPLLVLFVLCASAQDAKGFLPGQRVLLDAHNCYPYNGRWADRIQRALSTGTPLAIENDLAWNSDSAMGTSRAVVAHGYPLTGKEPTLRDYFFESVRPVVETALKENTKGNWPLIVLNVNDLRGDDIGLHCALWELLGEYEAWLCTAVKSSAPDEVSSLDVKPVLVLTGGGEKEVRTFYDQVPVGGKLRLFGSADSGKATNFRRWRNYAWRSVEPEGQRKAGDWTPEDAARLKTLVDAAHQDGLWVRFYTLDGYSALANQGRGLEYNFGSLDAVKIRWKAAIEAGVDFVATDQYEEFASLLRSSRKP
jgi:hypothetical protein